MTIRPNRRAKALTDAVTAAMEPLESRVMMDATTFNAGVIYSVPTVPIKPAAVFGLINSMSPQMIRTAYDVNGVYFRNPITDQAVAATGAGETIAIVDAFGDPSIYTDVQAFDQHWGLSSTDSEGSFFLTVTTPFGPPVAPNQDWSVETALDVEWAHVIAPQAHIDLIVVPDSSDVLYQGDIYAAGLPGVNIITNSWGSDEFNNENTFDSDFLTPSGHSNVLFLFSSGDTGVVSYPATSPNVLAIGGSTLNVLSNGQYVSEEPWTGSGGGTSQFETSGSPAVASQTPAVSWDANPNSGVWVYDQSAGGWMPHVGGTSASSPQWAGLLSLANQGRTMLGDDPLSLADVQAVIANDHGDFHSISPFGPFDNVGVGSPISPLVVNDLVGGGITGITSGDHLAFLEQPLRDTAGQGINPTLSVALEDSNGNILANNGTIVTLTIYQGPDGATTIFGTFNAVTVNGIATFTDPQLQVAGSYEIEAVDETDTPAISSSFNVTAAAPAKLVFLSQPTTSWQYGPVAPGLSVGVEDIFGNMVTTNKSRVAISIDSGPGKLVGPSRVAAARNGIATLTSIDADTPGAYTLLASDGLLAQAVSLSYEVVALPASTQSFLFSGIHLSPGFEILRERRIALLLVNQGDLPPI